MSIDPIASRASKCDKMATMCILSTCKTNGAENNIETYMQASVREFGAKSENPAKLRSARAPGGTMGGVGGGGRKSHMTALHATLYLHCGRFNPERGHSQDNFPRSKGSCARCRARPANLSVCGVFEASFFRSDIRVRPGVSCPAELCPRSWISARGSGRDANLRIYPLVLSCVFDTISYYQSLHRPPRGWFSESQMGVVDLRRS